MGSPDQPDSPSPVPSKMQSEPSGDRTRIRKSLLLSFTDRYFRMVLRVGSTMILARLLTPQDYGVYTIGLATIGIVSGLRDFGLFSFLIQEKHLTKHIIRSV